MRMPLLQSAWRSCPDSNSKSHPAVLKGLQIGGYHVVERFQPDLDRGDVEASRIKNNSIKEEQKGQKLLAWRDLPQIADGISRS